MLNQAQVLQTLTTGSNPCAPSLYRKAIGDIDFSGHVFAEPVNLAGAEFVGAVDFSRCVFKQFANFDAAVFRQPAEFRGASFEAGAGFSLTSFGAVAFLQSKVQGQARFWHAHFRERADFSQLRVKANGPRSGEANFSWARFDADAVFTDATFEAPVYFHRPIFRQDVYWDQCLFSGLFWLQGRPTDVLLPRFEVVDFELVGALEALGIFRPDIERHVVRSGQQLSEFVLFNHVLSEEDLRDRLLAHAALTIGDRERLLAAWREGAQPTFARGKRVTFRGAVFSDLEQLRCLYVDLSTVTVDRDVAQSVQKDAFEERLKGEEFDVFISHASEDKVTLARPLAEAMRKLGHAVWLDEHLLEVGDVLRPALDAGLERSRYCLAILSPASLKKDWLRYELERWLQKSARAGQNLLLVWHGVDEHDVAAWFPELATRVALLTARDSVQELAFKLSRAMR